jgi:hypothetical protein
MFIRCGLQAGVKLTVRTKLRARYRELPDLRRGNKPIIAGVEDELIPTARSTCRSRAWTTASLAALADDISFMVATTSVHISQ